MTHAGLPSDASMRNLVTLSDGAKDGRKAIGFGTKVEGVGSGSSSLVVRQ